jgi:hypothetical protein
VTLISTTRCSQQRTAMKILPDNRRLRIFMMNMINGRPTPDVAADAWQQSDGSVMVSGLWGDLVPFSQEDHMLMAQEMGISSLEWLRRRLMTCPAVKVEIFD